KYVCPATVPASARSYSTPGRESPSICGAPPGPRYPKEHPMTKRDYIHLKALVMGQTLDDLLPTYVPDADNPIFGCLPLPSESEVVLVLQLLDSVFFPGYREECPAVAHSGQGFPIDTLV